MIAFLINELDIRGGTHKQLLKDCSTYREIYQSQMGGDANE